DKVFTELAQRYAQRPGGYTRTTKLGVRLGDGAPLVQIELVK
ncbi:MAG: 50S ribosomal protein L17, partial [Chloroflexi bacterium]|nr:50S ribosomal protein L17 [Chloroflexota bacterium]